MRRMLIGGAVAALCALVVGGSPTSGSGGLVGVRHPGGQLRPAAFLEAPGPPDAPEWWVDSWQVHSLWAAGADGRGIVIGEIDSGVNASLPQLSGKVLPGIDFGVVGGNGQIDREVDPFGHGTAMASIMVATSGPFKIEGLAPAAKILPVAIPLLGTNDETDNDHLADSIRWAVDHGAKIINMSLGAARDPAEGLACPASEQAAVTYAISKGALLVAAAGNDGPTSNQAEEPGVCLGVVTVGAVDESGTAANFSSRHPYTTVTAPGVDVPSLGRISGQAYTGKGTSQATALTSAALALIWSKYPSLTNSQVLARLLATLSAPHQGPDPAYGYGEIDPAAAINTDVPITAPDPVFAAVAPFLAVQAEQTAAGLAAPPPATGAPSPPGSFKADKASSRITPELWGSSTVGLAGLVGLLLLFFGAQRRRRRFAAVAGATATPLWPPEWSPPTDGGLPWHDVFPPPDWAAPTVAPQWSAPSGGPPLVYPPATLGETPVAAPTWRPPDPIST